MLWQSGESRLTFRRAVLPHFSGPKSKLSKKPEKSGGRLKIEAIYSSETKGIRQKYL